MANHPSPPVLLQPARNTPAGASVTVYPGDVPPNRPLCPPPPGQAVSGASSVVRTRGQRSYLAPGLSFPITSKAARPHHAGRVLQRASRESSRSRKQVGKHGGTSQEEPFTRAQSQELLQSGGRAITHRFIGVSLITCHLQPLGLELLGHLCATAVHKSGPWGDPGIKNAQMDQSTKLCIPGVAVRDQREPQNNLCKGPRSQTP